MRSPREKRLRKELNLTRSEAALIRLIASSVDKRTDDGRYELSTIIVERCPTTARYVQALGVSPYDSPVWWRSVALKAIDEVAGTFGVESLGEGDRLRNYAPPFEYLNNGDPYKPTLIYSRDADRLYIGAWAVVAEAHGL